MLKKILQIFNWKEYISLFFTLFFIKYSFLNNFGFHTILSYVNFFLLVLSSISIIAIGDFLVYFFSQKHKIFKNNQEKPLFLSFILLALALGTTLYVFMKVNKTYYIFIYLFLILVTVFHVLKNYKKTLLNNIVISCYKPLSIISLWYIDFPLAVTFKQWHIIVQLEVILLYIIIVSFASNLNKHILIDLKNKKKDIIKKHKTLPIVFGEKKTKKILFHITVSTHLLAIFIISLFSNDIKIHFSIIFILYIHMLLHQIAFIYYLFNAKGKSDYEKIISKITNTLFIGILIFPIMAYYIKYVI